MLPPGGASVGVQLHESEMKLLIRVAAAFVDGTLEVSTTGRSRGLVKTFDVGMCKPSQFTFRFQYCIVYYAQCSSGK